MKIRIPVMLAAGIIAVASSARADGPTVVQGDPQSAGFSVDGVAQLDAAMDAAVDKGEVAGIETMLVRHGKIVDLHMHGLRSIATGAQITRDTIFRMFSQTKPMVGVAMMILYEKGLWKLDDPVTKFIPEFANLKVWSGTGADGKPILVDAVRPPTMRELMTHTAGFGYGLRNGNLVDDAFRSEKVLQSNGLHDMIEKIAKIPLLYQPGTRWSYSIATDIQGYIIEKITGESLSKFMTDNLWKPLGMKDTGFVVPPAELGRLSAVYVTAPATGKLFEITPAMVPALRDYTKPPEMESGGGGSVSTVDDYARFCQMILNKGEYNGVRILKPETVALMSQNQMESTVLPDPAGPPIGKGALGFGLDFAVSIDPKKIGSPVGPGTIWWGGAAGTWFWIDPENDLFFLGMIQKFGAGNTGNAGLGLASQHGVYGALKD
jgi:CubicO group peptidase (beta-lactamase class C family)